MLGNFECLFASCCFFSFKIYILRKFLLGKPSECQSDWIQIRDQHFLRPVSGSKLLANVISRCMGESFQVSIESQPQMLN